MLTQELDSLSKLNLFNKDVPEYVKENLNPIFDVRYYQKKALARLIYYLNDYSNKKTPAQLLFYMATGSGKTLLMAASMLYLYKKGYRNFIFFVNNTNVIEKTKDNFLNPYSSKYLFADKLIFNGKQVEIIEEASLEAVDENNINISFYTIQGLHSILNNPRENSLTFEDLAEKELVLISDEAHHINALTKRKLSKKEQQEVSSWEGTVNKILQANRENILLEYTATTELDHPAIKEKYNDKIIYQYSLKEFRIDGYSKEVKVLQSDLSPEERALQAVLISQYRRKVAEKCNKIVKPVILMKSKTIIESKEFEKKFYYLINNLQEKDLRQIRESADTGIIAKAFKFFDDNRIIYDNLVKEIKEDFSEAKCLSVNSQEDSVEKQLTVNSLEDYNNEIRVIFTVNMLNEGWDVLNLYDIVRLYETRDAKSNKPGKTTISEAQLIGRGARYYPFKLIEEQDQYKRKYDQDIENEVRILEELYYHSSVNPTYIQELNKALIRTGILSETDNKNKVNVKESYKESNLSLNNKIKNDKRKTKKIKKFNINKVYKYTFKSGYTREEIMFNEEAFSLGERKTTKYCLVNFGENIIRKALYKIDFFKFNNLRRYFPHLNSLRDFITSREFLAGLEVEVTGSAEKLKNIKSEDKLIIALYICKEIAREMQAKP